MSLMRQLLSVLLIGLLMFGFWRSFFFGLKHYHLNKSAYKKKKSRRNDIRLVSVSQI